MARVTSAWSSNWPIRSPAIRWESRNKPFKLTPINFPSPILSKAVYPKSKADLDKMSTGLARICEEDPSLKVQREADIGELLLSGMGDTHLEIAASRLHRKFGVEVNLEMPRVPYKETITVPVEAEYKHKKQTGGHGQYGHVLIRMEPLPPGSGFEFAEKDSWRFRAEELYSCSGQGHQGSTRGRRAGRKPGR